MKTRIWVAERFQAPAHLHSLAVPADALTRHPGPALVWILGPDGAYRVAQVEAAPDAPPVILGFPAFANPRPASFRLVVTEAGPIPPTLPWRFRWLARHRPPITLETPAITAHLPALPAHGLHVLAEGRPVAGNIATTSLPWRVDIENFWADQYGAWISGWAICGSAQLEEITLCLGPNQTLATTTPRPDVLAHYPQVAPAIPLGFAGYVAGPPGVPGLLLRGTAGATRLAPNLPARLTTPPDAPPPALEQRFAQMVNTARLRVAEIGSRRVSPLAVDRRAWLAGAASHLGIDAHPGPWVDLVGDVHALSHLLPSGQVDAVFSFDVLEHLVAPWLVAAEINRAMPIGGLTFHMAPHSWPVHERPSDFWRFDAAGLASLFGPLNGFEVLATEMVEPVAIHHPTRHGVLLEMPLHPGYGHALVLARKVADLPPASGLEAWQRQRLPDGAGLYPLPNEGAA